MAKHARICISKETIDKYNALMSCEHLDYEKHDIPRYETIESWTVNLGRGYEADIKVCSSDDGDPLWCEAVLFKDGSEVCCSDVDDTLDGEWELHHNQKTFLVNVCPC